MNLIDRAIAAVSPRLAAERARARLALQTVTAHYEAASVGPRTGHRRAPGTDADAAASRRARIAFLARDMIRNTPFAARAQQVVANNVVGDGIIPKLLLPAFATDEQSERGLRMIEDHLDTTAVDADGRQNLYGLQRLVMNTVVDSGEALVMRMPRRQTLGRPGLQIKVMEPDHLDGTRSGPLATGGGWVHEGIEYGADGRRVAYWLYDQHPGTDSWGRSAFSAVSRRVPASEVLHIYRQDRAGQMRGVSWFASVALALADAAEFQDAQLVRQKIAACFVAFRKLGAPLDAKKTAEMAALAPGLVQDIGEDEEITFGTPPDSGDFGSFMTTILRSVAAGIGITYEALTGDLSEVNFSSARMARIEMDRNVSSWQWTLMIPAMLHPLGRWFLEDWMMSEPQAVQMLQATRIEWVPPHRILVDPSREIPALREAVRAGFTSRRAVVRSLGFDPERLEEDIGAENLAADDKGLMFESDYRHAAKAAAEVPVTDKAEDQDQDDEGKDEARRGKAKRSAARMPNAKQGAIF